MGYSEEAWSNFETPYHYQGFIYRMVGNFREGFIFVFFVSQEPFTKTKTVKFCCPHIMQPNHVSIWPTSNYLYVLTATEVCQRVCLQRLSLKPFRKSKCYVSTDAQTKRRCKPRAEVIVSTNVLGMRLLFSPHWNKELRLPSLSIEIRSAFSSTVS